MCLGTAAGSMASLHVVAEHTLRNAVSTELEIWYRDLTVTVQCAGFPAQHPKRQDWLEVPSFGPEAVAGGEAGQPLEQKVSRTPSRNSLWHSRSDSCVFPGPSPPWADRG